MAEWDGLSWLERKLLLDEHNHNVEDQRRAHKNHPPMSDKEREARTPRSTGAEGFGGPGHGASGPGSGMTTDDFLKAVGARVR